MRNRLHRLFAEWRRRLFPPRSLGQQGEAAAARFLKRLGYKIVAHGERWQMGELDLVAVDGRTVVFVEVKTRRSRDAGEPSDAVNREKQRRLTRLALGYLKRQGLMECNCRFDVVSVVWPETARRPTIEHIKNAFDAVGMDGMYA